MDWEIKQPQSLTEVAVARIRAAIISGGLGLGEKLSEQMLADRFKISRTPVRDALAILQSEGLVCVYPKRGSFVFTPVTEDVEDLLEYRTVLEVSALRLGMKRNREALCERLREQVTLMQAAKSGDDPAAYTATDVGYHQAIMELSGNHRLALAYERMIGPVLALRHHLFTVLRDKIDRSLEEHILIADACRQGDLARATAVMTTHIDHMNDAYRGSYLDWERAEQFPERNNAEG